MCAGPPSTTPAPPPALQAFQKVFGSVPILMGTSTDGIHFDLSLAFGGVRNSALVRRYVRSGTASGSARGLRQG